MGIRHSLSKRKESLRRNLYEYTQIIINSKKVLIDLWRLDKKLIFMLYTPILILAFAPFAEAYFQSKLLDSIVEYLSGDSIEQIQVMLLLAGAVLVGLASEGLWKIFEFTERNFYQKVSLFYTERFLDKISRIDLENFEDPSKVNFIQKVSEGYDYKPAEHVSQIAWVLYQLIKAINAVILMFLLAPWIMPVLLLGSLPYFFISIKASRKMWAIWDDQGDNKKLYYSTSSYLKREKDLKEVRVFGVRQFLLDRLKSYIEEFVKYHQNIIRNEARDTAAALMLSTGASALVKMWLLLKVLGRSGLTLGDYTFYVTVVNRFIDSSQGLLRQISRLHRGSLYLTDYYKLLDTPINIVSKPNAPKVPVDKVPEIEFKNVTFRYPGTTVDIFKNFSLKIRSGEDIALVGVNGAGKTTMVKLLCRFYDVNEGAILINGTDLRDVDLESWYQHIGVLFQDFNHYQYSANDNIMLGRIEKKNELEEIIEAAKRSGAHDFIKDLKKGYDTVLSRDIEGGTQPSGGQWQKIALARAFFRDANILILDEPTSAIDSKSEYEIFNKISEMQDEKTTVIISHRFSTVKKADRIYVIDQGKIVEEGSHRELMSIENGKYKEMYELQAEGYKD